MHGELALVFEKVLVLFLFDDLHVVLMFSEKLKIEDLFAGPVIGREVDHVLEVARHLVKVNDEAVTRPHAVHKAVANCFRRLSHILLLCRHRNHLLMKLPHSCFIIKIHTCIALLIEHQYVLVILSGLFAHNVETLQRDRLELRDVHSRICVHIFSNK